LKIILLGEEKRDSDFVFLLDKLQTLFTIGFGLTFSLSPFFIALKQIKPKKIPNIKILLLKNK